MAKGYKYFFAAGLSGLLLALAYPASPVQILIDKIWTGQGFDLGWLAWIGLVPLFWSFWSLTQFTYKSDRFSVRNGFLIGFVAGLVYFLIIFRWFWSVHPLDTLGIQSSTLSFVIVLLIYIISSAGMAIFWGLFGIVYSLQLSVFRNKKLKTENWTLVTIPAIFVLLEYARSWGFGFLWAGSGSLFGPHWTLGNLAYALANNLLALRLASFVGIYGLTFLIVLVNCLIFIILKNGATRVSPISPNSPGAALGEIAKPHPRKNILVGLIVAILLFLAHYWNPNPILSKLSSNNSGSINYAIVQTAQPTKLDPSPQEALAGFKEQLELLTRVAKEHPESQLIVFPEASDFFKNLSLFLTPAQVENYFNKLFKEPRLIISGGRVLDTTTGRVYSRTFSLDTQGDIIGFYDKRLLTPGGEFLPYPIRIITNLFSKLTVSQFGELRELNVGKKEISTVGFRDQFSVAPLICSELISPGVANKTSQNADIIVSMASYGIFHGNRTIADQMLAITRFRAAENRKPIITATNMGRSYVIDNQGNIVFLAPNTDSQILTGGVDITQQKSWYNRWGNAPILLGSLVLGIVFSLQLTVYSKIKSWVGRSKSLKNADNL